MLPGVEKGLKELYKIFGASALLLSERHLPWQWMESREAKARFELPYRNWLSGFLSALPETEADEVGVYLVPSSLDEMALKGLVYDIGLLAKRRLRAEILVLTLGDLCGVRSGLANLEVPVSVLRVLSFRAGMKVLSGFLPDPRSALSSWLGSELVPAFVPPARWKVPGKFYIADCATGDISPVRALQTVGWHGNLPLKVIAPASWKEHLNYPAVEIVPPPPGWDTLVPPVPELVGPAAREDPGELEPGYDETWLDGTGWE